MLKANKAPSQCTVKPVNKGNPSERMNRVFIDVWSLLGGYFVFILSKKGYWNAAFIYRAVIIQRWPLIQV